MYTEWSGPLPNLIGRGRLVQSSIIRYCQFFAQHDIQSRPKRPRSFWSADGIHGPWRRAHGGQRHFQAGYKICQFFIYLDIFFVLKDLELIKFIRSRIVFFTCHGNDGSSQVNQSVITVTRVVGRFISLLLIFSKPVWHSILPRF